MRCFRMCFEGVGDVSGARRDATASLMETPGGGDSGGFGVSESRDAGETLGVLVNSFLFLCGIDKSEIYK